MFHTGPSAKDKPIALASKLNTSDNGNEMDKNYSSKKHSKKGETAEGGLRAL